MIPLSRSQERFCGCVCVGGDIHCVMDVVITRIALPALVNRNARERKSEGMKNDVNFH